MLVSHGYVYIEEGTGISQFGDFIQFKDDNDQLINISPVLVEALYAASRTMKFEDE